MLLLAPVTIVLVADWLAGVGNDCILCIIDVFGLMTCWLRWDCVWDWLLGVFTNCIVVVAGGLIDWFDADVFLFGWDKVDKIELSFTFGLFIASKSTLVCMGVDGCSIVLDCFRLTVLFDDVVGVIVVFDITGFWIVLIALGVIDDNIDRFMDPSVFYYSYLWHSN